MAGLLSTARLSRNVVWHHELSLPKGLYEAISRSSFALDKTVTYDPANNPSYGYKTKWISLTWSKILIILQTRMNDQRGFTNHACSASQRCGEVCAEDQFPVEWTVQGLLLDRVWKDISRTPIRQIHALETFLQCFRICLITWCLLLSISYAEPRNKNSFKKMKRRNFLQSVPSHWVAWSLSALRK